MPKKTKRAKKLSEKRIAQHIVNIGNSSKNSAFNNKTLSRSDNPPQDELLSKHSFTNDFKKSLMVIAIIFTLEIILYFVSMSNYSSKFFSF